MTDKIDQRRNSQLQKANSPVHWICTNFPHILSIVLLFSVFMTSSSIFVFEIQISVNFCLYFFFAWEPFYPLCTKNFQNDWLCLCCGFLKVLSDDCPGSLNNFVLHGELRICQPQNNVYVTVNIKKRRWKEWREDERQNVVGYQNKIQYRALKIMTMVTIFQWRRVWPAGDEICSSSPTFLTYLHLELPNKPILLFFSSTLTMPPLA